MLKKIGGAVVAVSVSASAFAEGIDVTAVTGKLTQGETAIAAVGAGVLVLLGIVCVYKVIRRAF